MPKTDLYLPRIHVNLRVKNDENCHTFEENTLSFRLIAT